MVSAWVLWLRSPGAVTRGASMARPWEQGNHLGGRRPGGMSYTPPELNHHTGDVPMSRQPRDVPLPILLATPEPRRCLDLARGDGSSQRRGAAHRVHALAR